MKKTLFLIPALFLLFLPALGWGQEVHQEFQELVKAKVLEVVEEYDRIIMGTQVSTTVQKLRIQLLSGDKVNQVVTLENDLLVLSPNEIIYVNRLISFDGTEYYIFKDVERRPALLALLVIFIVLIVALARWQGVRAILSLGLSIGAILFVLIPALLAGYSPALTSLVISAVILSAILFLTHGIRPHVVITFFGTFAAVAVTCLITYIWVSWMRLTGFSSDASVYLNFAMGGTLDLGSLLLGSIIIGLLGVLDDVCITQASVVQELRRANCDLGLKELYLRAIQVGRDHVGSLVNTLALAYVGAALPLILLYASSGSDLWLSVNQEVIAAEILRIVVGSIGLILAVPITTLVAAWYFKDKHLHALSENHAGGDHHHHHHHH